LARAALAVCTISAGLALACGDDGPTEPEARDPPTAVIVSPADGATYGEGLAIRFEGTGADPSGEPLTGDALSWESSLDGELGTGGDLTRADLSPGDHEIVFTAMDPRGVSGSDTVSVTIVRAPSVSITAPEDGAVRLRGQEITFEGSAQDADGESLTGDALVWRSDRDGELGTGTSFTRDDLSPGEHVVSLTAADGRGAASSDEVAVRVTVPVIHSPVPGSLFPDGTEIIFEGSALAPNGEPLTGSALVWTSDLEGQLGTGQTFTHPGLRTGTHRITLTATEPGGATASTEILIAVEAAFVLEGSLEPLPGRAVPPLEVRTMSGGFDAVADVALDGTFQITIPEPGALDSLVVLVDARDLAARTHFPIYINFGGTVPESASWLAPDVAPDTVLHHIRAALVPLTWTIENGPYAGQEVEISLAAATERARDGGSFIWSQDIGTLIDAAWPADLLPLPVAFHYDSSDLPITPEDSIAFWEATDRLQEHYGQTLFEPAVLPPGAGVQVGMGVQVPEWVTIRVDAALATAGAVAYPYWTRRNPGPHGWSLTDGTVGQVQLWAGAVVFGHASGLSNHWLVMHEMAHIFGLGHTCAWPSILGGSNSGCPGHEVASPEDVAYEQLKRAVGQLRIEAEGGRMVMGQAHRERAPDRIMFGLEYSRLGERVVLLGLPPYRQPAAALAPAPDRRVEVLERDGETIGGRLRPKRSSP
jgi:hypothetical protein